MLTFKAGQVLFLEGDDSQDLYILVSGHLDILKGTKKINHVTEKGTLFGEISFLLGTRRTAKAADDSAVIRIPKEEINDFLRDFPSAAGTIARLLARRLDEKSTQNDPDAEYIKIILKEVKVLEEKVSNLIRLGAGDV